MHSTAFDEHMDRVLDDALMGTFPASDPVSVSSPHRRCGPVRRSAARDTRRKQAGQANTPSPA